MSKEFKQTGIGLNCRFAEFRPRVKSDDDNVKIQIRNNEDNAFVQIQGAQIFRLASGITDANGTLTIERLRIESE